MSYTKLIKTLFNELISPPRTQRINEPDLIMEDPQQVKAYLTAGREGGISDLPSVYAFNTGLISEMLKPGDQVVDLACGPANQLCQVARLNPDCQFTGLDLSQTMLGHARSLAETQKLKNLNFQHCDISDLKQFDDHSVDVVMSTLALHHLPDLATLDKTLSEARRILKKDTGRIYLADFGRLKNESSIQYFVYQHRQYTEPLVAEDYFHSLRAAFTREELEQTFLRHFSSGEKVFSSFGVPLMVVCKSAPSRKLPESVKSALDAVESRLDKEQRTNLRDFRFFMKLGGLRFPSFHAS